MGPEALKPQRKQVTHRGRVKWFSVNKGYGFISRDDGSSDCFVHYSGIEGPFYYVRIGEEVEFELKKTHRGIKAVNVRSAGSES